MNRKIRVLVVDDSSLMRAVLSQVINSCGDMEVVGAAPDPLVAREMIKTLNPDVLTLDVEMPRMDGLEFLERLMRLRPMPVVMVSTLTERGSETTLKALELGAVDYIAKPQAMSEQRIAAYGDLLCEKLRAAATARVAVRTARPAGAPLSAPAPVRLGNPRAASERIVCIGASTGGTEAIKDVLVGMPEDSPGIVMVQHMPESFTPSFARRLDSVCRIKVKEAEHGEKVLPGHAYLAPGHSHLRLRRSGGMFVCELEASEPVNRHRPAVDVLFHSAAQLARGRALGVLLTGMGKDGAEGLLAMRNAGAWTICQDQNTCVVWGMPREAVALGAACEVVPLGKVSDRILSNLREGSRASVPA